MTLRKKQTPWTLVDICHCILFFQHNFFWHTLLPTFFLVVFFFSDGYFFVWKHKKWKPRRTYKSQKNWPLVVLENKSIDHEVFGLRSTSCMEFKRKASLTPLLMPHSPFGRVFPHSQFNARVFFSAKFISAPNEKLSEEKVGTVRLRRAGIDSGTTQQVWRQPCESDEEGAQDNIWAGNKK